MNPTKSSPMLRSEEREVESWPQSTPSKGDGGGSGSRRVAESFLRVDGISLVNVGPERVPHAFSKIVDSSSFAGTASATIGKRSTASNKKKVEHAQPSKGSRVLEDAHINPIPLLNKRCNEGGR